MTGLLLTENDGQHENAILSPSDFAGGLITLVGACTTSPKSGPGALAGTWINSAGTLWTIKVDGTFDVGTNHDGKPDI